MDHLAMRMQSASWHDYGAQEALELQTTMVQASQGSERIEASLAFMITTRASRLFKQSLLVSHALAVALFIPWTFTFRNTRWNRTRDRHIKARIDLLVSRKVLASPLPYPSVQNTLALYDCVRQMEMYEIPTYKDLNVRGLEQSLGMWPGAAGWNPAVGARLTDFFRSNLGRRVMSLVRLLFDRHGLQVEEDGIVDHPTESWFLDDAGWIHGGTVSDLKCSIWSAVIFHILHAPVPDAVLRLFIANAYFFQRQQQDPSSDGRQDLPLCSEFLCCNYLLSKLDELMAADATTTEWEDQEETLVRLTRSASVMARFFHGKTPQGDLLDLFDVTKILLELVYCWLLLQLGRNKKSLVWLTRLESQALAGTATAGGHGQQVEKLFLFLLDNFDYEDQPDRASLARLRQIHDSLSSSLVRIEWKLTNVLPGALQMLEELIAAHDTIGDDHVYGSHCHFDHWFRDHSRSYHHSRRRKRAFYPVDASELLGRLVHNWMRTKRGARDHARLQSLCCSTSKDFVEHVKQTLEGNEDDKRKLHDAAAVVFGAELSVSFVLLCRAVAWDESTTSQILEAEELGTINGKLIVQVDEHPVDTVVKLMVNVVLGDFLDVAHDRETWIRDCKVLLKKRCPLRLPWKPAASVHFLEDVTMERWREMDAWIRSPGTLSVASYEQALQAMRNAIFRDGRVVDQASKEFVTRIGKLLEAKEDQVYELIDIYTDERFQKACGTNSGTTAASKKRGRGSMAEFAVVANAYPVVMGLLSKRQRCHMFMRSGCPLQGGQAITTLDMMKIKVAILRVKRRLATVHVGYACYHGNKNRC
ncbi:uncharacterized protein LOC9661982 [Selaginella moellendorffii]|uniref:uncharacterized protein LOC9661982 n=1 Tax=Selaginella moellendorffii TaxID=88036 RepID=UPI000D1C236E|nr:uncharacterized protein LOC9661982 [Selaginella moellendorffii]|eukprot:XP_024545521.1 uncharacterized protein LOC9661982 [Selaginella moellendorffii]